MSDSKLKKLEGVSVKAENAENSSLSELQSLFADLDLTPKKDWSTATDEEVQIACAEAKLWLGF